MADLQPPPLQKAASPHWSNNTKLIVGLTVIFVLGALVFAFHTLIVPILMAFIVAYLLHPIAANITRKTPLSWKLVVNIIYLIVILLLLGLLVWGGLNLIGQIQRLISFIQTAATDLPAYIDSISHNVYTLGPFRFDFSTIDWLTIGQDILSYVQPVLGNLGTLVGTLATSILSILGWMAFVLVISYFFLLESGGFRHQIISIDIPRYAEDYRRLSERLGHIWNAYLRGQVIIFFSKVVAYTIILSILGVHYALPVALLAGFASFVPYIGPAITWITLGLVTFFQGGNVFGLAPIWYTVLAIGIALLIDQAFDNLVAPRIMSQALKVHPAFVLIAAIIAARLLGLVGIVLAAPLLASIQLLARYTIRKLLDQDPWPAADDNIPPARAPRWARLLRLWWRRKTNPEPTPVVTTENINKK